MRTRSFNLSSLKFAASAYLPINYLSYGQTDYDYSISITRHVQLSGFMQPGSIAASWDINGVIGYWWTQSSPNAPKNYQSSMPTSTNLSIPAIVYSGLGSIEAGTNGNWTGSSAAYTYIRSCQVILVIEGIEFSTAIVVQLTSSISWSTPPGTVYVNSTMIANAY